MTAQRANLWTIDELGSQVALALAENYAGQRNGSIRQVPDLRTIRYYTTLGLLDRPAQMRGRTALYGRRHLLQLVAIKRLQARGLTLREIQEKVLGLTDAALQRLAQVPASVGSGDAESPPESSRREEFWRQPPVPHAPPSRDREGATDRTSRDREGAEAGFKRAGETFGRGSAGSGDPRRAPPEAPSAPLVQGVRLASGVTVLIEAERTIDDDDIEAIRAAAGPLVKLLEKRRLTGSGPERSQS